MADIGDRADQEVDTDVLVVGGAGAGSSAAIAAARAGARVTLASKGALGKSGNTIMAGASLAMDGESAYRYGERNADPTFTRDVWFEEIVKQGYYLSEQDLVQQYVESAGPRVHELLEWGRRARQRFVFLPPSGWFTAGRCIGLACRRGVQETPGIDVIEDVMITDVLMNAGRAVGALGVDVYTGELIAFRSRAVVLATGGYQPFSFKCTVSDMTGDGMAMAYRAGAQLADMEFLLFLPGVLLSPQVHRGSIFPFLWYMAGFAVPEMRNGAGESITDQIPTEMMAMARGSEWLKLIYTYYWGKELAAGKSSPNGGVYFDFSNLSPTQYQEGATKAAAILKLWYGKAWHYQGEDFSDLNEMVEQGIPWEVGLSNEYSMGGIVVDARMSTGVPGLFAGGEVTSGVFGASRVADALTEMLVQGYQAGESAAEYAYQAGGAEIDADQLAAVRERILHPFKGNRGISPARVHAAIEAAADAGFGFIRDEAGLRATLREIERIRDEDLPQMRVQSKSRAYNYEWIEAMQVENLITCAEAGVRAALMRTESRGHHIRTDYPEVDHDNWLVRIAAANRGSEMLLTTRKPAVTRMPLPTGRHEDIMKYAIECESAYKNADAQGISR